MDDDLLAYIDALEQGDCFRVDAVLKESPAETTERVFMILADGSERGPYIRKRIVMDSGLGDAYERIWAAQQEGKRFIHLPRLLECAVDGDQRTVVMEQASGTTLEDAVLSPDYSAEMAGQVIDALCDAVMELHESFEPPLIHRDLKPSNVVVSSSGVTLIDFGIARTFDENATCDTHSFGTRGYAPPEQFGYGQTDERSDVYALGMLAAFCLLREEPSRALVETGFNDERIPDEMRFVLRQATAFDPKARLSSVRAMKEALSPIATSASAVSSAGVPSKGRLDGRVAAQKQRPRLRIPPTVGLVWNVLIVATWLLFLVAAVSLTISPSETEQMTSPIVRAVGYGGMCVVAVGLVAYALMDRRWLRARFPKLSRIPWYVESGFCILWAALVVLASAILTMLLSHALY